MQLKAVFPEHVLLQNMPRADDIAYSLNLLDDLMDLDKEWSVEDFAQHAYSLGYDVFVLGWSDRLKGLCVANNIDYMHCLLTLYHNCIFDVSDVSKQSHRTQQKSRAMAY